MKKIKGLTMLVLGAALIAGCNKDSKNDPQNGGYNTVYTTRGIDYPVAINYALNIAQSGSGALIKWNNGYLNADQIVFNATYNNGNEITQVSYGTKITQAINLFATKAMGIVNVPKLACNHASFVVGLDPVNSNYALFINGTYNKVGVGFNPTANYVPVQVVINEPVNLNSIWINNVTTMVTSNWEAVITLSTDQLISGIDAAMMNSATMTNGTIIISGAYNANLYQIILNNLQNNLMPVEFTPVSLYTPAQTQPFVNN